MSRSSIIVAESGATLNRPKRKPPTGGKYDGLDGAAPSPGKRMVSSAPQSR